MKPGKKAKANAKNNRELKKIFENLGISWCEECGSTFHLTYAHSMKRRFIQTDQQMKEVALLCLNCHDRIEHLPHSEMYQKITEIIALRGINVNNRHYSQPA
jgi:hypothetical protein